MSAEPVALLIDPDLEPAKARIALVWGRGMHGSPKSGPEAPPWMAAILERVRAGGEAYLSPIRKAAVRDMLRHGTYKPAGRAKPSSEYLLTAALEGTFPMVNGPVDINNALSLEYGYPASVFDLAKCGSELLLRRGLPGEAYVFNASGQEIDLEDLLCVCARSGGSWRPCGNPVKDAMATKVFEDAVDVAAVLYAPSAEPVAGLESMARRFAELLASECAAPVIGWRIHG